MSSRRGAVQRTSRGYKNSVPEKKAIANLLSELQEILDRDKRSPAKILARHFLGEPPDREHLIYLLVAWSVADFDLKRIYKRVIESSEKVKNQESNRQSPAAQMAEWLAILDDTSVVPWQGSSTSNYPQWDLIREHFGRAMYLERQTMLSFSAKEWPLPAVHSAYSGNSKTRIYQKWAISVLRILLENAGLSESEANDRLENLYWNLGVSLRIAAIVSNFLRMPIQLPDPNWIRTSLEHASALFSLEP